MTVISVVNVRNTFESSGKSLTHLGFAYEALAPGFRTPWKVKGAVIREVPHDRIEIMPIERCKDVLKNRNRDRLIAGLLLDLPRLDRQISVFLIRAGEQDCPQQGARDMDTVNFSHSRFLPKDQ